MLPNIKTTNDVLVLIGPTGSGKTEMALDIVKTQPEFELVNVDSMQVYKELEVGNNKGKLLKYPDPKMKTIVVKTESESYQISPWQYPQAAVPLWLVNFLSVGESLNVAEFQVLARACIENIIARGKKALLVGGSGYYIHSILYDYDFPAQANVELSAVTVSKLHVELEKRGFDLSSLNNSDLHNPRRLQNYLRKLIAAEIGGEVAAGFLSAKPQGKLQAQAKFEFAVHKLEVNFNVYKLKLRARVEAMFAAGLAEEGLFLLQKKRNDNLSPQIENASGYKELLQFLQEKYPTSLPTKEQVEKDMNADEYEDLLTKIVNSHYQVARKQHKWNKKYFA